HIPMKISIVKLNSRPCGETRRDDGLPRSEPAEGMEMIPVRNPFVFGEEELRLLQRYIMNSQELTGRPDHMTREQVLFYLFALHDYDKSNHMDGLELLTLLTDFLSQNSTGQPSPEAVIPIVDGLLETQDSNKDGLLSLSELLFPATQENLTHDFHQQEPEVAVSQNAPPQSPGDGGMLQDPQQEMAPEDQWGSQITERLE
uniref:Cell growth regulator with EF-hand domain 1 n=1 Tax=Latimeria chalumnae TaxID=7897 RepID=H3B1U4_LATCH